MGYEMWNRGDNKDNNYSSDLAREAALSSPNPSPNQGFNPELLPQQYDFTRSEGQHSDTTSFALTQPQQSQGMAGSLAYPQPQTTTSHLSGYQTFMSHGMLENVIRFSTAGIATSGSMQNQSENYQSDAKPFQSVSGFRTADQPAFEQFVQPSADFPLDLLFSSDPSFLGSIPTTHPEQPAAIDQKPLLTPVQQQTANNEGCLRIGDLNQLSLSQLLEQCQSDANNKGDNGNNSSHAVQQSFGTGKIYVPGEGNSNNNIMGCGANFTLGTNCSSLSIVSNREIKAQPTSLESYGIPPVTSTTNMALSSTLPPTSSSVSGDSQSIKKEDENIFGQNYRKRKASSAKKEEQSVRSVRRGGQCGGQRYRNRSVSCCSSIETGSGNQSRNQDGSLLTRHSCSPASDLLLYAVSSKINGPIK